MKWIGQHIWDFISRFRSDVYLEGTETGTIASGGNLGLDSNNKIVKANTESGELAFNGSTANGVLTYGGAAQVDVESNLTYNSDELTHNGDFTIASQVLTLDIVEDIEINADTGNINFKDGGTSFIDMALSATTGNMLALDAKDITTGSAIKITDATYNQSNPLLLDITDTTTTTLNRTGKALFNVDYERPSGSPVATGNTIHTTGVAIRMDDNATNVGTSSQTGLNVYIDNASSNGTVSNVGIKTQVGGSDDDVDIKMINNADDSEYAVLNVRSGGSLVIATTSDDATGNLTLDIDGDVEVNADGGHILFKDNTVTLAAIDNIGSATVTGGQIVVNRKFAITSTTVGDYDGDVVYFGSGSSNVLGEIVHYKSDGSWEPADANDVAKCDGLLGVALGTTPATHGVLLRGMVTIGDIDGTEAVGDVLFLSEDATGHANCVAPSANPDVIRIIGYCLHATNKTIWFNPDNTFIEHA